MTKRSIRMSYSIIVIKPLFNSKICDDIIYQPISFTPVDNFAVKLTVNVHFSYSPGSSP